MQKIGKNTARVLDEFGNDVVLAAMRNLGTRRIGKNTSYGATKKRSLAKSLTFSRNGYDLTFSSPLPYANFIHFGVSGTRRKVQGSPYKYTNKQPPISAISKWLKVKPVRLRDENGKFIKQTPSRIKSAAFLIARSIKKMGIPKLEYYTEAWESRYPKWKEKIAEAQLEDVYDEINARISKRKDNIKFDK